MLLQVKTPQTKAMSLVLSIILIFIICCSSDMVKISMDTFVKRFQPDKYLAWIAGEDIANHPEDPPSTATPAPLPSDQDILVNKK